jgi:hypothetical protein
MLNFLATEIPGDGIFGWIARSYNDRYSILRFVVFVIFVKTKFGFKEIQIFNYIMQIPRFSDIKISTETVIAVSNLQFNIGLFFKYIPITNYTVIKRKRGRKRRVESVDPNLHIPPGSIISVQNKQSIRGVSIKRPKASTKENNHFLNSVTIVVVLDEGKQVNVKLCNNGKFQITGCKDESHYIKCTEYIYRAVQESERVTGETICWFKNQSDTTPRIVFDSVMKNKDYKVGFSVNREKLNTFISEYTEFIPYYEGSITTGVNIKIKSRCPYDSMLKCIDLYSDNTVQSIVPRTEYTRLLDKTESRKKDGKTDKYHTFLVFYSGSVIQSGRGPEMESIYNDFMTIMTRHRHEFEEKLNTTEITTLNY